MWFLFSKRGSRLAGFVVFSIAFVISQLLLMKLDLHTTQAHGGIISLEFAATESNARQIITSWNQEFPGLGRAFNNTYTDFIYIIAYSTCLGLGCLWAHEVLRIQEKQPSLVWRLIALLPGGQTIAGLLDYMEDFAILKTLNQPVPSQPWPALITVFTIPKWILIILGLGYIVYAIIVCLHRCQQAGLNNGDPRLMNQPNNKK